LYDALNVEKYWAYVLDYLVIGKIPETGNSLAFSRKVFKERSVVAKRNVELTVEGFIYTFFSLSYGSLIVTQFSLDAFLT
jgi:hypothetical protein